MPGDTSQPEDIFHWLAQDVKPTVDSHIKANLKRYQYNHSLQYQVDTGGKRLRPGLTLLSASLCGLSREDVLDTAAGIELIHTFSLIHDDLVDGDRYRRDEPTFWVEYNKADAVNIGDMLLTHALLLFPKSCQEQAIKTVQEMTKGQQMDLEFSNRRDVTIKEYMEMVKKKTGTLFDLSLDIPQTISETDLGIDDYSALWPAFQIRDDLLDFEKEKGRESIGNDVRMGKRSLMAIHADSENVYRILDKEPEETTQSDIQEVMRIYREKGSFAFAHERMHEFSERSFHSIDNLPDSTNRCKLEALSRYLVDRDI